MLDAIRVLLERAKLMAEISGAASTAALLSGRLDLADGTETAVVVSGGNFDVSGKLSLSV